MFFRELTESRHDRWRCIISWSRPLVAMASYGVGKLARSETEIAGYEHDAEHHRPYQAGALEEIGPNKGFYATPDGIQPYEPDGGGHIDLKRDAERAEDQQLQHGADHEKPHGGAEDLRYEEYPCSAAVAPVAEPLPEVAVDRYQPETVEKGHEHNCYHHITHYEAQHHLEVGVAFGGDHAGYGDERDARYGGADHGKGHHRPGGAAVAGEESVVVAAAGGEP